MKYKIKSVITGACTPDEVEFHEIGKKGVVEIKEHRAQGEGDKWYYDVQYKDGSFIRCFDPIQVANIPDDGGVDPSK